MTRYDADWEHLFPDLAGGDDRSRAVMDGARVVSLPSDEWVFRAGSPCQSYMLLLDGSVRVQVIGENGREALLYRVVPGQSCVLTTCCILAGEPYPAEGYTESAVRALVIDKRAFDEAMGTAPAFRQLVFVNLGGRIADVITRMEEVAFRPVERRLAAFLLSRGDAGGVVRVTHQEAAAELGTVREVISRHLKRFEASGFVDLGRSTVTIRRLEALRRLADTPM